MSLFDTADPQPTTETPDPITPETPGPEATPEATDTGETSTTPVEGDDGGQAGPTETDREAQGKLNALKEERAKRQRKEQENEILRSQLVQLTQQVAQPAPKPPSYEELDSKFYGGSPTEYIDRRLKEEAQLAETRRVSEKMMMSQEMMRSQHEDYEEVIAKFNDAAKSNPALDAQMRAHPHPAQFAYEHGRVYAEVADVGGLDGLKEKIKAEVRAEVIAEMKAKAGQDAAAGIVPSNAGARGSGTNGAEEPTLGSPGRGMFE